METLKSVREKMALSQDELSVYLGISRSQLANVENGNKILSVQAVEKLTQLYTAAQQNNRHLINAELVQYQNDLDIFLQQNSRKNWAAKNRLQKKLSKMQDDYFAALQTLQTIRSIKNNVQASNTKDALWCSAVEASLLEKIKPINLIAQKKLELKIMSL